MKKLSKRTQIFHEKVDTEKLYRLTEAIDLLKEVKTTKFDETLEEKTLYQKFGNGKKNLVKTYQPK